MLNLTLIACGDEEPANPGGEGDPATSVPGNEPGDDDGGGMNGNPDAGGDDTTGGSNPEGGTTGDPD
jgi:hypothetical protein